MSEYAKYEEVAGRMHQPYESLQSVPYNESEHQRETRNTKQLNDNRMKI